MAVALQAAVQQPPTEDVEVDHFVVCLFRCAEGATDVAWKFVNELETVAREHNGKTFLRADNPKTWEVFDGHGQFVEPDHLNPAIFDFNCVSILGFGGLEHVHNWWSSDEVHELLSLRESIEKMGIFAVEGLQKATDMGERNRWAFGDRLLLLELMNISHYEPAQQYTDKYQQLINRIGLSSTLLFAESVSHVLASEFPIDHACATSWRMKSEAQRWYDTDLYKDHLMPLRKEASRSLSILIPIFPDPRIDELERATTQGNVVHALTGIPRSRMS